MSAMNSQQWLRRVWWLGVMVAGFGFGAGHAQTRIMPLGNSITEGVGSSHSAGYRYYLFNLLGNAGVSFDFVGSLQDGSGFSDTEHEGHSGFRAEQLDVTAYLTQHNPDYVLLEVGTNDISQGDTPAQVRDDIAAILDAIHAYNPAIQTYLSTVVPRKDNAAKETATEQLNALLPALVSDKVAAGHKLVLVDNHSRLVADPNWETTLMADNLHPNDSGYELMATEFFNAIQGYQPGVDDFADDFNGGVLSANWTAHPAFQVQSNQLVNTATVDAWDNHLAIPNVITNPNVLEFTYGSLSNAEGRYFTGVALLLDRAATDASGYLLLRNETSVRLFTIVNGLPGVSVATVAGNVTPPPQAGDRLRVEWHSDAGGHHFVVYLNDQLDAVVDDPAKLQGNAVTTYAGMMVHGNTSDGVDDFHLYKQTDATPPAFVSDLSTTTVTSTSVELRWTAPGDDGNTGTARSYDLRYATSLITEANFNSATPVAGLGNPKPAGSIETVTVSGLRSGTRYYFALKSSDEIGNTSALSNVVEVTTTVLTLSSDTFDRPGPSLGANWAADARLQIINNEVQHTATIDIWTPAVFKLGRNAQEVSIVWGQNATVYGANFSGVLVLADSFTTRPNGYMIQHSNERGKTRLWHMQNGNLVTILDEGTAFGPNTQAGSEMKVIIRREAAAHFFDVYINGVFDRTLSDPNKRENGSYSGFVLESTLGAENALTQFEVGVQPGSPAKLLVVSGDKQTARVRQKLANPLKVSLYDSFDNPVPGAEVNFTATLGQASFSRADNNIRLEAESGQITAPLVVQDDPEASGGKYLVYPVPQNDAGSAVYTFNIPVSGTYYIWARNLTPGESGANSWTVRVDGGAPFVYDVFQGQRSNTWKWDLLSERGTGNPSNPQFDPKTFEWAAGQHTLVVEGRFDRARLDKFLITRDASYIPQGKEEGGSRTDENGIASTEVVLGTLAGPVKVEAQFGALVPAVFHLTAKPGFPGGLVQPGGSGQSGPAGQFLAQPFTVVVTDSFGNPTADGRVSWVVTEGTGQLSSYRVISDSTGRVEVDFAPGNGSSQNKVEAAAAFTSQRFEFTAQTSSGVASAAELVSGSNQTGAVASTLPAPLVLRVADAGGQPVAGFPVEFETMRGGGTTSGHNLVENSGFEKGNNGLPSQWTLEGNPTTDEVRLNSSNPHAGSRSVFVNANRNGVGISQVISYAANTSYTLTFWAKVDSGVLRVSWRMNDAAGNQQETIVDVTAEATAGGWRRYLVTATNQAAANRQLFFRTLNSGKFRVDDVSVVRNTGADGRLAVNWTLGDTVGTQQVRARARNASGADLSGSPVVFTAQATVGAAARLVEVSGNNQLGTAGQPLGAPFVVKVTDVVGNPVSGSTVLFEVIQGGGNLAGATTANLVTNAQGLAQVVLTLGSNATVSNQVRASAAGLTGSPIVFTAGIGTPARLAKVSGDNQVGTAGSPAPGNLVVKITDAGNKAISGASVTFTVQQGNGTINGQSTAVIRTDGNGEARALFVLGPLTGGENRVRASAEFNGQALQGSPQNFVVRAAALKEMAMISGNNQTGIAGETLANPFRVMLVDTLNHGVPQQEVTFTVIEGGGRLDNGGTSSIVRTDSTGRAQVRLTLGSQIGTNNNKVRAQAAIALPGSPQIFQASAQVGPPAVLKKIDGDSLSGVVNNPLPEPFVVQVTDRAGNPLFGVKVIFEVLEGGGNLDGVTRDTVTTNDQGRAQVTLTLGATSGLYNNKVRARAFNGSLELQNSPMLFVATAAPSKARVLAIAGGNRQQGLAGEPLANPLRVRVLDSQGNPIKDHPVRFRSSGIANGTFSTTGLADTTVVTNANGIAEVTWILGSTILPDSQMVTASANDGLQNLQGSPATFKAAATPGLPSARTSTITASGPVPANGQSRSTITVTVKDKFGNALANKPVQLLASGSDNNVQQPGVTDAQGRATGSLASTKAELKIITAKVDGVHEIKPGTSVRFTPLAATQMAIRSGHSQSGNVNTALLEPLSVLVTDQFNNGVPNVTVVFSVEAGEGRLLGPGPVVTDSNGVAAIQYVLGPTVGENRVRASATGLRNSPLIFVLNAVNNPARSMQLISGNGQTGVVLEELLQPLVVGVVDKDNRPVAGKTIKFEVTFGGGQVNGGQTANVSSDEFGLAKVVWRLGPSAGLNVVRASGTNLNNSPLDFQAQARTGRPVALVEVSGNGAAGAVNQTLATPLVVRVVDANSNGIDGVPVIFELIQGGGQLSNGFINTANGGFASTQITFDGVSGPRKIRASANGLANSPLFFTVTATPGTASRMQAVARTNNQSGTAGLPLNFPLQTKVTDIHGNPIAGVPISYVVKKGGGNFAGQAAATIMTNAQGIAQVPWTVGPGANEAEAIGTGLSGSPIEFRATGVTGNNFPILVDVPDQQAVEGNRIEFVISATDADNEAIRYSAANLPPGAVFDSLGTRIFTWQTDLNSAGRYEVSFFARDLRGGRDEEIVVIEVTNKNQPPVIVSRIPAGMPGAPQDTTVLSGRLTMRVNAVDPDGDVLSYRWYLNGELTSAITNTFEFDSKIKLNAVEAWVFDLEDTVRTRWTIRTPVQLETFSATAVEGRGVRLEWVTSSESNNAGFNLLRSRSRDGGYESINLQIITPSQDGRYSYLDTDVEVNTRYFYKLEDIDLNGNITVHGPLEIMVAPPSRLDLAQNYPNPFNPSTNIRYQLPQNTRVKLVVYNLIGQEVRELVNTIMPAGYHTAVWDGRDQRGKPVPSGIYHYRLEAGGQVLVKRMTLVK
ncbi:MAG: Ig-like domain-containing protein [candidate division KSB1 bacterium]|nr:Ig-like domain-containing protein [candidate division KSB1 bacterium]MDZ7276536.1 Ig-like domain-containing protein [candidate division KSB1 bacterium]MDZ7285046.1 Ig-like domain-containing protein [candidate division KSB1 bacterium]MDZ7298078.1 Ig-like domain-containing protein [candidate division KSB1 bacterium]MDZ7307702.1 Ig-like domain-containing protein [candidate division KSB1 bacterium]